MCVSSANASLTPVSVQVSWNHQFQFAGLYAAIKQGYYEDAGLNVSIKDWQEGINSLDEVVEKRADFAVSYSGAIHDHLKGQPIQLVMSFFQYSPLVLLSHDPINEFSDLANKRVMFYNSMQIQGMLNLAAESIRETITPVENTGNLQDFIDRKTDLYAAYLTNEPYRLQKLGVPFHILDPKSYGIQSYGDLLITHQDTSLKNPQMVESFKQATIKGWQYAIKQQEKTVDFILKNYDVKKSKRDLMEEAKRSVHFVQTGKTPIGDLSEAKLFAIANDGFQMGIINKQEFQNFNFADLVFHINDLFTPEERAYLATNPQIELINRHNWQPFEFTNSEGEFKGIVADTLQLISDKTGITFVPNMNIFRTSFIDILKTQPNTLLPSTLRTTDLTQDILLTSPYLTFPQVIAAPKGTQYIDSYQQLNGKTVAVIQGQGSYQHLKNRFPNIDLKAVHSAKEGLEAVINNQADAYSGNLAAINYAIRKYGLDGLQIIGQSSEPFELAMGVPKNNPMLFSILEKTLNSFTEEEKARIYNNWFKLEMVNHSNPWEAIKTILPDLIALLAIILMGFVWVLASRREQQLLAILKEQEKRAAIERAKHAEQEASLQTGYRQQQGQFFAMLTHEIKTPLAIIDGAIQSLRILPATETDAIHKRQDRINRAIHRINGLVERFLQQYQFETNQFELDLSTFNLDDFCQKLAKNYSENKVEVLSGAENIELHADAKLLEFALNNLIDNAYKYSPEGSAILLSFKLEKAQIRIQVIDEGPGINANELQRLLKPYVRGQKQGDVAGAGLGLYFVQKIANLHQGSLQYHAREDKRGSIFSLNLSTELKKYD